MKIAVCDDSMEICMEITSLIRESKPNAEISIYSSGEALLNSKIDFDLVFLDVAMKALSGIDTAKRLRTLQAEQNNKKSIIVFITAFREFMEQAFDVNAFNYIVKPIDRERFFRVLTAAEKIFLSNENQYIVIKSKGIQRKLLLHDIYYIESNNKKVIINTKSEKLEVYGRLSEFEELLKEGFFRCHRCYLVNMESITAYDFEKIHVVSGEKLPLSNKKYRNFVKAYLRYARRGGIVNV